MTADLKYAFRSLGQKPGFTAVAAATLALGIGASTAIFSVLNAVLLRPLPYPQQERVVELRELDEKGKGMSFAQPNFDDLHARSRSFAALAQYNVYPDAVAGGTEPVRTMVSVASQDFFRVLGVAPKLGRFFSPNASGAENEVAVVSYGFWQRSLGGRTNLEGTALRFANRSFVVIGVMQSDTAFPPDVDVWIPAEIFPPVSSRTAHNWRVCGRLKPGVSPEQARSEISSIGQQLKREHGSQTDAASFGMTPLRERLVKDVRGMLLVLAGAVGLLLVIAASNVANLLLVRATARRKEVALRAALGASRARLARQFITEALVLTLLGGATGVVLAYWGVGLIVGLYHGDLPRIGPIGVDPAVLLFALAVSILVGVALGLLPTFHLSKNQLQGDLQEAGRGKSTGRSTTRFRNILIVSQVALTLMLLIGAGLLGRSFQRLVEVNPGFQPESAVAMTVLLPQPEEPAAMRQVAQFYQQLLERLNALPGVISVGGTNALPLSGDGASGTFIIEDGSEGAKTIEQLSGEMTALAGTGRTGDADYRVASAGYFSAMGIPLLHGRFFEQSDGAESQHVALVSQTFARRFFPAREPIGQMLQFGNMDGELRLLQIVGVVGDVRDGLETEPRPIVYTNYFQRPAAAAEFSFVLRGKGDAAGLISAMRREARALNPEMPTKFQTLEQVVAASLDHRRFSMMMLGVFAGAALLLAMVGLYGIMAYITSERTTEIGIRMALGAQRMDMLRMIMRQSLVLVGAGIGAGIIAALGATRLLRALLYGIGAGDPWTYGAVVILLALAAGLASYLPARRAMRVDPIVALRHE
jgi:predicted permease